ncbi:MAG: polymer-forming cytoskeletal protein [Acidobacteria bacterium]|nr:MAG: polymer-forming cytoskeletal protein [Acidobacteriota bacterium]
MRPVSPVISRNVRGGYEMWKRDEAVRQPAQPAVPTNEAAAAAPAAAAQAVRPDTIKSQNVRDVVNIGKSVVIKGELNGSEDLTIEGHVEGKIELRDHVLTIGPNGKIKAELFAKSVVVLGEVIGNVSASEKVDIRENGSVEGDITSPRVAIAEGAHFRGSVDMAQKTSKAASGPRPAEVKPQPAPQPVMQAQQAQKVG